jgi:aryl-alcohol dehydrogenase-like predicted oxidoreductase
MNDRAANRAVSWSNPQEHGLHAAEYSSSRESGINTASVKEAKQMKIQKVPLGKSGILVPPLGIGAWSWGDRMFWGYGKGYDESDVRAAFDACMRAGINFFDTAEIYGLGQSEKIIGRFLETEKRPVQIATKYFPFPFRLTKGSLQRALRGSLRRLGVETVELYQIHQPFSLIPETALMEAMAKAVREGRIRAVGVSNYSVEKTRRAAQALEQFDFLLASNQVSFSLLNKKPETTGLLALCRDLGITVIAYSPLAMGMLSGRYTPASPPRDFRSGRYPMELLERLQPLLGLMREIGQAHGGRTPVQVALNWVMAKGAIPIPGVKNIRQAEDALGALGWQLAAGEMAALDSASDGVQVK